ncbi:MAG TPA: lamin tail domain-containing protein [Thermoanaerobaculia bacterium]|nr:lamin tail domain-containing protein [Thermoanaerobaculia bacterium]
MHSPARRFVLVTVMSLAVAVGLATAPPAEAISTGVVISQVYGGGGNTGATYRNDFIELFNRGTVAVNITGWSVQYASSAGTSWAKTDLTGTIPPGGYYLVQEAAGTGGTVSLPTPDAIGTIAMSGTAGKVALVNNVTLLTGSGCPFGATVVDFVGYGTAANCSETSPTATLSNTTAAIRGSGGCTETDANNADFATGAPTPRNTTSPTNVCSGSTPQISVSDVTAAEGNSGTTTFNFEVTVTSGTATFDIATANGTATVADSDYVAKSLTSESVTAGTPYVFAVTVNGDTTFEPAETFTVNLSNVAPGTVNVAKGTGTGTITNDDAAVAEIFAIQGSGAASPYAGQIVTTNDNVVTAVGTQGFFIQTPTARADADPNTSNGIYVFTSTAPTVAVGDLVDVTGTVVEYFNFTEFSPVTSVTADSSGNLLPAPIEFDATLPPTDPAAAWWTIGFERLEGMLVHVASGITSGPNQRFGGANPDLSAEIYGVASPNRPFREPGIKYPGLAGLPVWDGNPEVFEIDPDRLGATPDPDYVPAGSTYTATGVMAYEFSGWEIWPSAFSFTPPVMPRPVRAPNGGEFTVGTYNLLQLDATAGDYAARLQKHSAYIRTVLGAPDVLGVQECMSLTELTALAARIHADDAGLNYTPYLVEGHDIGGIDNGFLVRDTVTGVTVTQLGYDAVFAMDSSFLHDRPPLLLEASYVGNGAPFAFTVMVNHTRSLNSIDDPVDGNRVRNKRLAQAQWIAQAIQDYQTLPANLLRPYIMVGDLNAYEISDGYVDVVGQMAGDFVATDNLLSGPDLVNPNLTKQALSVAANDRYSYNFGGTAQVLDHALTTQATNTWVRGFAYGRGNTDSAVNLIYDASTPLRSSDHDGAVLFLMSDANGDGIPDDSQNADLSLTKVASPDPVLTGGTLTYTLTVSNAGPVAAGPTTVTDALPTGVSFVSATGTGWSCVQSTGVVSCDASAMPVGAAPAIVVTVTVTATSGTLTNTAEVSSFLTDSNPLNNTATAVTTVTPLADLAVTMTANPAATGPGGTFTHSASVTNLGPSAATAVSLVLTLPAGAVAGTIIPGACLAAASTVTCTVGSLAMGGTFAASVEMTAATTGFHLTTGVVSGAESDPNPANNTASATTAVGQIVATPNPVNMRVPVFSLGSSILNITNDSPLTVGFSLLERPIEYAWARFLVGGPTWKVPAEHASDRTARAVPEHPLLTTPVSPLASISDLNFPVGLVFPWGIGFNTMANDMWINDNVAGGGDGLNHRFLASGTATGETINVSSWVGSWAADMTYDPFANRLWQVNVGGDNCIYELDPSAKISTGNKICPAFGTSERGLAFDPVSDTFFAGSWNDGVIHRFDRNGDILESFSAGLDVSGLAYNPGSGHLFVLTNSATPADLYVLDVNNAYANVASFKIAGMGSNAQAGLEADCAGNLYAVNMTTKEVLVVPSGETGFCSFSTVPWLDETPKSGTLAPGATQPVTLDFITALQWPGLHQASLRVAGTDPFAPVDVPVNYTIAFLDVPVDHWADAFIHALAGVRVSRGCGEGNFCPEAEVDRAEMAILMVRAMHGPLFVPPAATGVFVDVPISETDVTADYIEQLYHDGVVAGCAVGGGGERYYCPDRLVSRAEMSVFVSVGLGLPPVNPPTGYFSDVHGTGYSWAEGFIETIFNEGITAGCGDHLFCPATTITRAQLAVWLVVGFNFPYLPPTP